MLLLPYATTPNSSIERSKSAASRYKQKGTGSQFVFAVAAAQEADAEHSRPTSGKQEVPRA